MKKLFVSLLMIFGLWTFAVGQNISVFFYGTPVEFPMDKSLQFTITEISDFRISKAWKQLTKAKIQPVVKVCTNLRESMNLNGWAIYKLVTKISEQLVILNMLGKNEAAVLGTYLLNQLGYEAKLACLNNRYLFVACTSEERLASIPFMSYEGKRYYLFSSDVPRDMQGRILPSLSNNAKNLVVLKTLDFTNSSLIKFEKNYLPPQIFNSATDLSMSVEVSVNKNQMDFFAEIPQVIDLSFYAKQPLDPDIEQQLVPPLRNAVKGRNEVEAVNMLLKFMHTAFNYMTDIENFGFEKSYYKEEMFYYSLNDCEDRSITFTYLVEKILGLDTIILEYPGHASTGVRFNDEVTGDFITLDGVNYVLCDPSYLNSEVGSSNPDYIDVPATIYKKDM